MAPTTYVALESVRKSHGVRTLLQDVSLGVLEGARIGVVGRNGSGKTTLVEVMCGVQEPDGGRVTRRGGLHLQLVTQTDDFATGATLGSLVVGERPEHEWAGDARIREVMHGLLGGPDATAYPDGLRTPVGTMSGGERRRAALARALLTDPDVLVLDEPTNHLDIEAVHWLAEHLAGRAGALVVVTHDRWFLDVVCTQTWEVADGAVHAYDGGYAAYVLARAERERRSAAAQDRRANLLRKELAWLRRGPPARTSKPRFRIDAANELIADEPPVRDRLALQRFATARLGRQVYDVEDVSLAPDFDAREVLHRQTWRLGPGDRVGLLGPNGAGKTTVLRLLAAGSKGELDPGVVPDIRHGTVRVGRTVAAAHLSQGLIALPDGERVLESLQRLHQHVDVGGGRTLTAQQLLEGFGLSGERLSTRVADLSGGERRRLQLLRLLVDGPNVLLLDEPTNDLDVETLTVLEDLLDSWPGTLVVVSHDRYFLERTTDTMYALLGDGALRHLPGGVEQYLQLRAGPDGPRMPGAAVPGSTGAPGPAGSTMPDVQRDKPAGTALAGAAVSPGSGSGPRSGGQLREARKRLAALERRTEKLRAQESELHERLAAVAVDHEQVRVLGEQLTAVASERASVEDEWLELAAALE